MKPAKGMVAFCTLNTLGLITNDEPQLITYQKCDRCNELDTTRGLAEFQKWAARRVEDLKTDPCTCQAGIAYVGIHLTDKIAPIGSPWSSRTPKVICKLEDLIYTRWNEMVKEYWDWRRRGGFYASTKPCRVCGTTERTGIEPRFGYVVCEVHQNTPPNQVLYEKHDTNPCKDQQVRELPCCADYIQDWNQHSLSCSTQVRIVAINMSDPTKICISNPTAFVVGQIILIMSNLGKRKDAVTVCGVPSQVGDCWITVTPAVRENVQVGDFLQPERPLVRKPPCNESGNRCNRRS